MTFTYIKRTICRLWAATCGGIATFLVAMTAVAADTESLSEAGFRPAEPSAGSTVDGGLLLIIAYAAAWCLIAGYLVLLSRRANTANEELRAVQLLARDLEARLDEEGQ